MYCRLLTAALVPLLMKKLGLEQGPPLERSSEWAGRLHSGSSSSSGGDWIISVSGANRVFSVSSLLTFLVSSLLRGTLVPSVADKIVPGTEDNGRLCYRRHYCPWFGFRNQGHYCLAKPLILRKGRA